MPHYSTMPDSNMERERERMRVISDLLALLWAISNRWAMVGGRYNGPPEFLLTPNVIYNPHTVIFSLPYLCRTDTNPSSEGKGTE